MKILVRTIDGQEIVKTISNDFSLVLFAEMIAKSEVITAIEIISFNY